MGAFWDAYHKREQEQIANNNSIVNQNVGNVGILAKINAAKQQQEQVAREQQFRAAIEAAPTDEAKRAIAMKFGTPPDILSATKPQSQALPDIGKAIKFLDGLPPDHPARPKVESYINNLAASKQEKTPTPFSGIGKLKGDLDAGRITLEEYKRGYEKAVSHAPAASTNVYSGSLTQGVDAQGNYVFVQASPRADTPPRVVKGVFPPEKADQRKAKQSEMEGQVTAQNVRERIARMGQLIQGGGVAGGVVGPLGVASKVAETAIGAVKPDTPTPAIDYENEQALLLSDVRKLVEKDPNLSKDERERLYQTLGGGFWQTPGSAMRAMNNVVDYVDSKKLAGPSRNAKLESTIREAGWDYEPSKYVYRIVDGKVQRKLKE